MFCRERVEQFGFSQRQNSQPNGGNTLTVSSSEFNFRIFIFMKTTILSLCMAFAIALNAQFIPQQMGYNPDVNGDELIGVEDLMGTLSLYGNSFDNGDSLIVQTISFPEEEGDYFDGSCGSDVCVLLDDLWDIVYFSTTNDANVLFELPEGIGYKVVQVFVDCDGFAQVDMAFYHPASIGLPLINLMTVNCDRPRVFTFIRGHNGIWYGQAKNEP